MLEVMGLPLHPLVVHAAVVLVPLASVMAIIVAVDPMRRRRFGLLAWLLSAGAAGAAFLAKLTGEELAESTFGGTLPSQITAHADAGGISPWFALALFGAVTALLLLDLDQSRRPGIGSPLLPSVLSVLVVLIALGATMQVLWTGWTGTDAVWSGTTSAGGTTT